MLTLATVYAVSPDLVLREAGEILIMVSTAFNNERSFLDFFSVSATGRSILSKLDGKKTLDLVIQELMTEYDATFDEIKHDVQAFITDLENKQVLIRVDVGFPPVSQCRNSDVFLKDSRQQSIRDIKNQLGWAYFQLKWPQNEQIPHMIKARDSLLESLSGQVNWNCSQNKIHYGSLSAGCVCCGEGTWHCLFVNSACTAKCFYCPQDRKHQLEHLPLVDEMAFRSPEDFASFASAVGARGISFSGGEPLLFYPAILSYIKALRQKLGGNVYLWMYTNGDLIDRDKLAGLKNAGLDEIRLDIAARQYSLTAARLAVEFFENVCIEIPAIPEDLEKVKSVMDNLKNYRIHYMNLHQLLTTEYNYPALAVRNYTFLHHPGAPVFESEITALTLLDYAVSKRLPLQVNYCSQSYKERIHSKNRRQKALPFVLASYEEATEKMYIRRISVKGDQNTLKNCAEVLVRSGNQASSWKMDETSEGLVLVSSFLTCLEEEDCKYALSYYRPSLTGRQSFDDDKLSKRVFQIDPLNNNPGFLAKRELLAEFSELSPLFMKCFYRLIVQKQTWAETIRWFVLNYPISNKDDIVGLANSLNTIKSVLFWEKIEKGLPDIY